TSSLAAPPPSSVSGLIEEHLRHSQQHQKKKKKKNSKLLILKGYFGFLTKTLSLRLIKLLFSQPSGCLTFTRQYDIAKVIPDHQTGSM
ncbi:hypothetical protein JZX86_13415, partial [Agrobacterium rosae]|uniref:hypothetical protein n=1 Tax=Agrobacterium rosae TaxID=1972867 RepID=UPI0019D332D9